MLSDLLHCINGIKMQEIMDRMRTLKRAIPPIGVTTSDEYKAKAIALHADKKNVSFQLLSFYMDKNTGVVQMRGRSDDNKCIGISVDDYEHSFCLSRQTPFKNDQDAIKVLSAIESGLHSVAQGSTREFITPDPRYSSKRCASQTVKVNSNLITPSTQIITGWSLVGHHKSGYGWTPDDYREPMLVVWVLRPIFSNLIHRYTESKQFREYYTRQLQIPDHAFSRRHMLRTFEACISPELVFRTKYNIGMAKWCTINLSSPTCKDLTLQPDKHTIHCDSFFACNGWDIVTDHSRVDNANLIRAGFDIESPGQLKKDGKSRFPVPRWGTHQYTLFARDVLSLPPPVGRYALSNCSPNHAAPPRPLPNGNRHIHTKSSASSCSDTETEEDSELEDIRNNIPMDHMAILPDNQDDDNILDDDDDFDEDITEDEPSDDEFDAGDGDDDDDDGNTESAAPSRNSSVDENKVKQHNLWAINTRNWSNYDWNRWMTWALQKKYTREQIKNMLTDADLKHVHELLPDAQKDVDRARCICVAVKHNNVDVGDNQLIFQERVAFVYIDPDQKEPLDEGDPSNYAANIWKMPDIKIHTFDSEAQMINAYLLYRREKNIDIEESWNGRTFDHVFLYERLLFLRQFGTDTDRFYAKDLNFGFRKGHDITSMCRERFTSTSAGGDRLERYITHDLLIHNDGYQILTNPSFGEKNRFNSLDYISMKKLIYSRDNVSDIVNHMMASESDLDLNAVRLLYKQIVSAKEGKSFDLAKEASSAEVDWTMINDEDIIRKALNKIFEDVPMRKMQYDINQGIVACMEGGRKYREFIDYCFVDSSLPILIGGKLSLQIAISRATNVTPTEVFGNGVQMKVLALLYAVNKYDFKERYLIPDKGTLNLHWPGVFDDEEFGFELAVREDPRLNLELWSTKCNTNRKYYEDIRNEKKARSGAGPGPCKQKEASSDMEDLDSLMNAMEEEEEEEEEKKEMAIEEEKEEKPQSRGKQ